MTDTVSSRTQTHPVDAAHVAQLSRGMHFAPSSRKDHLHNVRVLYGIRLVVDALLEREITAAHAKGASWQTIATAMGVWYNSVYRKYSHLTGPGDQP